MQIRQNISLKPFNTFSVNASARWFANFGSTADLEELLSYSVDKTIQNKLVLGGGSNILLTKDFDGLVMKNDISGIVVIAEDEDHIYLRAGAGENWHQLVMYCVANNYAGIENLSLIPGNVGASPMQNIGAYGVEIKEIFHRLEAYHIKDRTVVEFTAADCKFGYRESVFKKDLRNQFVILNVSFRLNKKPEFKISYGAIQQELEYMGIKELSLAAVSQAVINIRSSKLPDPKELGNAGSFFKNPVVDKHVYQEIKSRYPDVPGFAIDDSSVKLPAAWLIEACGWKGFRKGDAGCHIKQPLVLVNFGNASGGEIYELSEEILKSVRKNFSISLEREVNIY